MEGSDAELLAAGSDVLGSQHGSVGGGLVTVGLDLHTTSDTADGLTAGKIGDVDEGIVEGGEDTGNAEDELALADLGTQGDVLLGGTDGLGLGRHRDCCVWRIVFRWWLVGVVGKGKLSQSVSRNNPKRNFTKPSPAHTNKKKWTRMP